MKVYKSHLIFFLLILCLAGFFSFMGCPQGTISLVPTEKTPMDLLRELTKTFMVGTYNAREDNKFLDKTGHARRTTSIKEFNVAFEPEEGVTGAYIIDGVTTEIEAEEFITTPINLTITDPIDIEIKLKAPEIKEARPNDSKPAHLEFKLTLSSMTTLERLQGLVESFSVEGELKALEEGFIVETDTFPKVSQNITQSSEPEVIVALKEGVTGTATLQDPKALMARDEAPRQTEIKFNADLSTQDVNSATYKIDLRSSGRFGNLSFYLVLTKPTFTYDQLVAGLLKSFEIIDGSKIISTHSVEGMGGVVKIEHEITETSRPSVVIQLAQTVVGRYQDANGNSHVLSDIQTLPFPVDVEQIQSVTTPIFLTSKTIYGNLSFNLILTKKALSAGERLAGLLEKFQISDGPNTRIGLDDLVINESVRAVSSTSYKLTDSSESEIVIKLKEGVSGTYTNNRDNLGYPLYSTADRSFNAKFGAEDENVFEIALVSQSIYGSLSLRVTLARPNPTARERLDGLLEVFTIKDGAQPIPTFALEGDKITGWSIEYVLQESNSFETIIRLKERVRGTYKPKGGAEIALSQDRAQSFQLDPTTLNEAQAEIKLASETKFGNPTFKLVIKRINQTETDRLNDLLAKFEIGDGVRIISNHTVVRGDTGKWEVKHTLQNTSSPQIKIQLKAGVTGTYTDNDGVTKPLNQTTSSVFSLNLSNADTKNSIIILSSSTTFENFTFQLTLIKPTSSATEKLNGLLAKFEIDDFRTTITQHVVEGSGALDWKVKHVMSYASQPKVTLRLKEEVMGTYKDESGATQNLSDKKDTSFVVNLGDIISKSFKITLKSSSIYGDLSFDLVLSIPKYSSAEKLRYYVEMFSIEDGGDQNLQFGTNDKKIMYKLKKTAFPKISIQLIKNAKGIYYSDPSQGSFVISNSKPTTIDLNLTEPYAFEHTYSFEISSIEVYGNLKFELHISRDKSMDISIETFIGAKLGGAMDFPTDDKINTKLLFKDRLTVVWIKENLDYVNLFTSLLVSVGATITVTRAFDNITGTLPLDHYQFDKLFDEQGAPITMSVTPRSGDLRRALNIGLVGNYLRARSAMLLKVTITPEDGYPPGFSYASRIIIRNY